MPNLIVMISPFQWHLYITMPLKIYPRMSSERELCQLMSNGVTGGSAARGDAQLAVDRTQVRMHGTGADYQLMRDLIVGVAERDQAHAFASAFGQLSRPGKQEGRRCVIC